MTKPITVQFWNDLICPICPIGQVMLRNGIELFSHSDSVEIVYRSFRLRPGVATHTVDAYLKGKYGNDANVPAILAQVDQMGAQAGLIYKMANTRAGDTMDAHRLVHLAQAEGLQAKTVDRIHKAHFAEGQNIFDRDVLVRLAVEIGLDRNTVASMLTGDKYKAEVEAEEQAVRKMGVSSVPFFLINDQIQINGGQAPEQFRAALEKAWQSQSSHGQSRLQTI